MVPDDDQAMVLPCASVMVIMVLLNDAATCATPDAMFFLSRRRTRVASLPILDPFAARCRQARAIPVVTALSVSFSCRRWSWPAPCGCVHWYGCADRAPAGPCGGAGPGSSRDPSAA